MKDRIMIVLILGASFVLGGCQMNTPRDAGTLGTGPGALVGGASGQAGTGAAIGAVGGGIIGAGIETPND